MRLAANLVEGSVHWVRKLRRWTRKLGCRLRCRIAGRWFGRSNFERRSDGTGFGRSRSGRRRLVNIPFQRKHLFKLFGKWHRLLRWRWILDRGFGVAAVTRDPIGYSAAPVVGNFDELESRRLA